MVVTSRRVVAGDPAAAATMELLTRRSVESMTVFNS